MGVINWDCIQQEQTLDTGRVNYSKWCPLSRILTNHSNTKIYFDMWIISGIKCHKYCGATCTKLGAAALDNDADFKNLR